MPLCRITMIVLACLVLGLSTAAAACDHAAGTQSESPRVAASALRSLTTSRARDSSLYETTSIVESTPGLPKDGCSTTCPGVCCCQGGTAPCTSAHTAGHVNSGWEPIVIAGVVHTRLWPLRAVYYREPLYGLDRPPKA